VRFNRARKRYERQGILVEETALKKAEQDCVQDAGERSAARVRAAVQRAEQDRKLVARMPYALS
jgi:multidrug resistance efflux pump